MSSRQAPAKVREARFTAAIPDVDLATFREELVALAGGFTEIGMDASRRYIVGLRSRDARQKLRDLLARWSSGPTTKIDWEDRATSTARDEVYFLLPLQRNPAPSGRKPREPMFSNEERAAIWERLGTTFGFRPIAVAVYGEWRNDQGVLVPDHSFLMRIPDRGPQTPVKLRGFLRKTILGHPRCDQDYIYMSVKWVGELVAPS